MSKFPFSAESPAIQKRSRAEIDQHRDGLFEHTYVKFQDSEFIIAESPTKQKRREKKELIAQFIAEVDQRRGKIQKRREKNELIAQFIAEVDQRREQIRRKTAIRRTNDRIQDIEQRSGADEVRF